MCVRARVQRPSKQPIIARLSQITRYRREIQHLSVAHVINPKLCSRFRQHDKNYTFVSAWEYQGEPEKAKLHKEILNYEEIEVKTRSYK